MHILLGLILQETNHNWGLSNFQLLLISIKLLHLRSAYFFRLGTLKELLS